MIIITMAVYIGQALFAGLSPRFNTINDMFEWINGADSEEIVAIVNKVLPAYYVAIIQRGTWVNTIPDDFRYRNTGALMYDGERFIDLDYDYCDYGIPPLDVIPEFSVQKWADCNDHNCFVRADLSAAKILNIETNNGAYCSKVKFLLAGNIYYLIILDSSDFNVFEIMEESVFSSKCDEPHDFDFDPDVTLFYIDQ